MRRTLNRAGGWTLDVAARSVATLGALLAITAGPTWAQDAPPQLPECTGVHGAVDIGDPVFNPVTGFWEMDITAGDGSVLSCTTFDIGMNNLVRFMQPHDLARVLAKVTGMTPTEIEGKLMANGSVFLVNPAGIIFTSTAVIDVGTIYAAAGDIDQQDFVDGNFKFDLEADAMVENHGQIVAARAVHMLAGRVANYGSINAAGGVVSMVSAEQVTIMESDPNGQTLVIIDQPGSGAAAGTGVLNGAGGTIQADNVLLGAGDLYSLAISNEGTVNATGDVRYMANAGDGHIDHDGTTDAGGDIEFQGTTSVGGGAIAADERIVFTDDVTFDGDGNQGVEAGLEIQFGGDAVKTTAGTLALTAGNLNFNNADGEDQTASSMDTLDLNGSVKKATGGNLLLRGTTIAADGASLTTTDGSLIFDGVAKFDGDGAQALAAVGSFAEIRFTEDAAKSTAGDLRLIADVVNFNNPDGMDQTLAVFDGTLDVDADVKKATDGNLVLDASLTQLAGASTANLGGDLVFTGDVELDGGGDQALAAAGDFAQVQFGGNVDKTSGGDLQLLADVVNFAGVGSQHMIVGNGDLVADPQIKKVTAGNLTLGATNLRLGGDTISTTQGNLVLGGNVDLTGGALQALLAQGHTIQLGGDVTKSTSGDVRMIAQNINLAGNGDQAIAAADGDLDLDAAVKKSTAGNLSLQGDGIMLSGDSVSATEGNLILAGDVNFDGGSTQIATADGWAIQLGGDMTKTTSGDLQLIARDVNLAGNGDQMIAADDGMLDIDASVKKSTAGALSVRGTTVNLGGDSISTTQGNLIMVGDVNFDGGATQVATADGWAIQLGGDMTKSTSGDLQLVARDVNLAGSGDQMIAATDGNLDVDAAVKKSTAGHLSLAGDNIMLSGDSVSATQGNLVLNGNVDFDGVTTQVATADGWAIQLGGDMTKSTTGDLQLIASDVNFAGSGDQMVAVSDGILDVDAAIKKSTSGNLGIAASEGIMLAAGITTSGGDLTISDTVTFENTATVLTQGGKATFDDEVILGGDLAVDTGSGDMEFNGVVRATSDGAGGLTVRSDGGDATFRDDLGVGGRLAFFASEVMFHDNGSAPDTGRLVFVPGGDGVIQILATGDVDFNSLVNISIPEVATITVDGGDLVVDADGSFTMGMHQKLTVLGNLTINVDGTATLGDMSSTGFMTVQAGSDILLLARAGALVLTSSGLVMDDGLDFFTNSGFIFNKTPIAASGTSGVIQFASPNGAGDLTGNLTPYVMRVSGFESLKQADLVLDGVARGATTTDIAEVIANPLPSAAPRVVDPIVLGAAGAAGMMSAFNVSPRQPTGSEARALGTGLAVFNDAGAGTVSPAMRQRQVVVNRLSEERIETCLADYEHVFGGGRGQALVGDLGRAWGDYVDAAGDEATPDGFVAHLVSNDDVTSLEHLRNVSGIFDGLEQAGLNRAEMRAPADYLLGECFPGLDADGILAVLDAVKATSVE